MEALILVIDMGVMLYLCWKVYRTPQNKRIELGILGFKDKSDET